MRTAGRSRSSSAPGTSTPATGSGGAGGTTTRPSSSPCGGTPWSTCATGAVRGDRVEQVVQTPPVAQVLHGVPPQGDELGRVVVPPAPPLSLIHISEPTR